MINYYGFQNLEKLRFCETISNDELIHMVGNKEPAKSMDAGKIYLIKIHNNPSLILGLVYKITPDYVLIINKTEQHALYNTNGLYDKSSEDSSYKIDKMIIEYVSSIGQPKDADLLKKLKIFAKGFKEHHNKKSNMDVINSKHYPIYNSKKDIPESIYAVRSDILINPEYQILHNKGILQLLTLIYRLKNTKNTESKMFYEALSGAYDSYITTYELMDYGYIDSEIMTAFTLNRFNLEKHLFTAFLKGHKLFSSVILELYKEFFTNLVSDEKPKYVKIIYLITSKEEYSTEEKAEILNFIKDKVDSVYWNIFE